MAQNRVIYRSDVAASISDHSQYNSNGHTMQIAAAARQLPTFRIDRRQSAALDLNEVCRYRELLYFLIWRDIKVRYKQTVLGGLWALMQPVLMMVVFTFFLGRLAHVPSDGAPYSIFFFCAVLPWQLFARGLTEASSSLVVNERLITKVYFPRLIVPLSAVLAGLLDFAISFVFLLTMAIYYGENLGLRVFTLPLLTLLTLAAAFGVGLWLSALSAKYRDVRYTIQFLVQLWLFATPVAYPSSLIATRWRSVLGLNPMAGTVEGFRWALIGTGPPPLGLLITSVTVTIAILIGGLYFFRHVEGELADII